MGPSLSLRLLGIRASVRLATVAVLAVVCGGLVTATRDNDAPVVLESAALFVVAAAAVLLHETARTAAYRAIGVRVRAIDLTIAGGSPLLLDRTVTPRRELIAALAGLAAVAGLAVAAFVGERFADLGPGLGQGAHLAALALAALALLQAMPVLPLDGGRCLRALMWYVTDDPAAGSRGAAVYGQVVCLALVGGGLALLTGERQQPYWGLAAITAGVQLSRASLVESREAHRQKGAATLTLARAGLPIPRRMAADVAIGSVVEGLIDGGSRAVLLIEDGTGQAVGVVRLRDLRRVRRSEWEHLPLAAIMTPLTDLDALPPETPLFEALLRLEDAGHDIATVTTDDGRLLAVTHAELLAQSASAHPDEPD